MNYIVGIGTLADNGNYTINPHNLRIIDDFESFKFEVLAYLKNNPTLAYSMFPDHYAIMFAPLADYFNISEDFEFHFKAIPLNDIFKGNDDESTSAR